MKPHLRSERLTSSKDRAGFVELEPWQARGIARRIPVPDIAKKIRLHMPRGKKLLLTTLTLPARAKELLIQLRIIKPGHRSTIQAESTRRDDQVRALER